MSDRETPAHWPQCPTYPPSEEALMSIPYTDHAETNGPGDGALAIRFAGRQVRADRNDELLAAVIGPEYLDEQDRALLFLMPLAHAILIVTAVLESIVAAAVGDGERRVTPRARLSVLL